MPMLFPLENDHVCPEMRNGRKRTLNILDAIAIAMCGMALQGRQERKFNEKKNACMYLYVCECAKAMEHSQARVYQYHRCYCFPWNNNNDISPINVHSFVRIPQRKEQQTKWLLSLFCSGHSLTTSSLILAPPYAYSMFICSTKW